MNQPPDMRPLGVSQVAAAAWKADTLGQQQASIGLEVQRPRNRASECPVTAKKAGPRAWMQVVRVHPVKAAQGSDPC